jgi:ABC-type proline/glycine betaine transport system permease subunit
MVPLGIFLIALTVLFEVYKSDFERWVRPLTDWLRARKAWSWVLPVVILFVLSFPPLFGHEIVQIIVGVRHKIRNQVVSGFVC